MSSLEWSKHPTAAWAPAPSKGHCPPIASSAGTVALQCVGGIGLVSAIEEKMLERISSMEVNDEIQ